MRRVLSCLFLTVLPCCALAAAPQEMPTPESVIGFEPGTDMKLADWPMIRQYFDALDRATDRVALEKIGKSTLGKEMFLAAISSEENVAGRAAIKAALRRMADPRGLSEAEERRYIGQLPVVVFVGCAQHASEIGSTQMSMEAAYRLAAGDSPAMETIRRNVIFLLVPSLNPDGHQMECEWYAEQLGTPFEGSRMPWLYHKYVGHDINRDWAMNTQVEPRLISRVLYEEWFPQIVVDVHQMGNRGARMFIPPYHDPINPNIDPLIEHELALISAQMRLDLSAAGHTGIITNAMFDEWLLGYFTSVPSRHNMVTQLIELASVNRASPVFQRRRDLQGSRRGLDDYSRRANFPEPWEGGWWRLRDIVEYEQTAVFSLLGLAARNREVFLENFVRLGRKQIEKGKSEPPFAFLVPPEQSDPAAAWRMVQTMMCGGVDVHEAKASFVADGIDYPAGTQVVFMAQPYRAHAKDLLEKQTYPDLRTYPEGPPERPYDVSGWTLPLLAGVKTVQVVDPFDVAAEKLERTKRPPARPVVRLSDKIRFILVERSQNNAYILVNRLLASGGRVRCLGEKAAIGARSMEPGTFLLAGDSAPTEDLREQMADLGLVFFGVSELPDVAIFDVKPFRLGLYQPWTASMDEGWTRWVLERYEFPYRTIHDAEIRAGGLEERYDVLILPDLRTDSIVSGVSEGSLPGKYTGGIGEEGVFALRDFVREGGTLVGLDSSCGFLIDKLALPLEIVREEASAPGKSDPRRFFCPGSILRIEVDASHPLCYGLGPAAAVMHMNSPVFDWKKRTGSQPGAEKSSEQDRRRVTMVGSYPQVNPLLSGWIEHDDIIHGKGALASARFGEGKAVLIGFRCQSTRSWMPFRSGRTGMTRRSSRGNRARFDQPEQGNLS